MDQNLGFMKKSPDSNPLINLLFISLTGNVKCCDAIKLSTLLLPRKSGTTAKPSTLILKLCALNPDFQTPNANTTQHNTTQRNTTQHTTAHHNTLNPQLLIPNPNPDPKTPNPQQAGGDPCGAPGVRRDLRRTPGALHSLRRLAPPGIFWVSGFEFRLESSQVTDLKCNPGR